MGNAVGQTYWGDRLTLFRFDIIRAPYKGGEVEALVLTATSDQGTKHAWGMAKPLAMKLRDDLNRMHVRFGHEIDYLAPEVLQFAASDTPKLVPGMLANFGKDILKVLHLDVGPQIYILDATTMGDSTARVSLCSTGARVHFAADRHIGRNEIAGGLFVQNAFDDRWLSPQETSDFF